MQQLEKKEFRLTWNHPLDLLLSEENEVRNRMNDPINRKLKSETKATKNKYFTLPLLLPLCLSLCMCKCIDKYKKSYTETINVIMFVKEMGMARESSFRGALFYCWDGFSHKCILRLFVYFKKKKNIFLSMYVQKCS